MHIHRLHNNVDLQLNALRAAQQAEAKQQAAETRNQLLDFASVLQAETEESLFTHGEPQENERRQQRQHNQAPEQGSDSEEQDPSPRISHWA